MGEANRDASSGIVPLRFPLVPEVAIDPVVAIVALVAFAALLLLLSLFSAVAHCHRPLHLSLRGSDGRLRGVSG